MQWDYLQDQRTDEQYEQNKKIGKEKEKAIIGYLKQFGMVYECLQKDDDEWKWPYWPDCILLSHWKLIPIEVKYTTCNMKDIQWKYHQYKKARVYGWYMLCVANNGFCLISSHTMGEYTESWYCNKPCIIFHNVMRYPRNSLKWLFEMFEA
jgi:hypothetical protein